ncbi:MAG: alpha-L-fucosidase [Treponema sp.]|jgi:alpha-L-fucosidase|nr:alpha-L-fucosidase [Treponema sp.]
MALPKPTKSQFEWHEIEKKLMICLDPATWQRQEYDDLSTPLAEINPSGFDAAQWAQAALSWGAGEIILVAKHVGGFCLWQTDTSPYGLKETPFQNGKGDIVDDLYKACKKQGLKFGIYLSPADRFYGAYTGGGGKTADPAKQEAYNNVYRRQLTELLKKYPDTFEIWFDGGIVIPVGDILEKYAPDAMILQGKERSTIRWAGNEAGEIPYPTWDTLKKIELETGFSTGANSSADGDAWAPVEADVPLYNHNWFWAEKNESKRRSLEELVRIYYKSVGRGAVLLLNATPDTAGRIPEGDMKRYGEFGKELERRFSKPLAAAGGTGNEIVLELGGAKEVNHVILMEDYAEGERVRAFTVSALADGQWAMIIRDGSMIGRKQIVPFETVTASALKLEIGESVGTPHISSFEAYNVKDTDMKALCAAMAGFGELHNALAHAWVETGGPAGEWAEYVLDISHCVLEAGQYRVTFRQPDDGKLETKEAVLVLEGIETAGLVEELGKGVYRVTRSAGVDGDYGKSTALRFRYRRDKAGDGVSVDVRKI